MIKLTEDNHSRRYNHIAKVDVVLVMMHAVRGALEEDSPGEVRG